MKGDAQQKYRAIVLRVLQWLLRLRHRSYLCPSSDHWNFELAHAGSEEIVKPWFESQPGVEYKLQEDRIVTVIAKAMTVTCHKWKVRAYSYIQTIRLHLVWPRRVNSIVAWCSMRRGLSPWSIRFRIQTRSLSWLQAPEGGSKLLGSQTWAKRQPQQRNPAMIWTQMSLSNVGQVAHVSLPPWVTLQKVDITRLAGSGLGAGATALQIATLPLVHSTRVLRCCLVLRCSFLRHWPCPQRCLANYDWVHASYTNGQPSQSLRHPTCWALSQRSHTVSSTPCYGACTPASFSAYLCYGSLMRGVRILV